MKGKEKRKVKFYTLGCKVNQYETQALMEDFQRHGFEVTTGRAELYIVNTCSVTRRADTKCKDAILNSKKQNPQAKIAVVGCFAQLNPSCLRALGVDYVVGQDNKYNLLDIILNQNQYRHKSIWSLKINKYSRQRAFVKIQDGCDNFCTFCKIPYLRGKPTSRPKEDIIQEVKRLSRIHKEIVLSGVNIGCYGKEKGYKDTLLSLVKEILSIESLGRIRLGSLDPVCIDNDFLSLFKNEKLCPHLHLPFQSGDNKILERMNKKGTQELYRAVVEKARGINSLIAISCDIMVGFPDEDEKSFSATVDFLEDIKPMRTHIFRFSPREKTIFENMKIKHTNVIKQRYTILRNMAQKWAYEYKNNFRGKTLSMICEEKKNGVLYGYTENYLRVCIPDTVLIGSEIKVKVINVDQNQVYGEPLGRINISSLLMGKI